MAASPWLKELAASPPTHQQQGGAMPYSRLHRQGLMEGRDPDTGIARWVPPPTSPPPPRRFAALVVIEATDGSDADAEFSDGVTLQAVQYISNSWPIVENDGSYDFDSVLAQRGLSNTPGGE